MKRLFLSNIIFLVLINLLIKPFYVFVIEVGVQNQVGPAEYGIFFSLFNFCYLFQIITDLGLSNYNNTTVAKNPSLVQENLNKILGLKLILALTFIFTIYLSALSINYPQDYYPLLWFIAANQILVSFIIYFRTNITAIGFYRLDSMLSVLDKLILIFILGYLLWIYQAKDYQFSIAWFVYAQMASLILTLLVVFMVLIVKVESIYYRPTFDLNIIKQSLPFALIILTMSAYSRIDGVMLERLLDDGGKEAGIYAASYRILDAMNIIGFLFAGLLLPIFSKLIAKKEKVFPTLILAFQLLFAIAVSAALYCSFYGDALMLALYPSYADDYYALILTLLSWGFLGIATTHIFGTLLTASHSLKRMNIILFLGFLINILLNLYFIPLYKAQAAATTTLLTEVSIAIGLILLVFKEFKLECSISPFINLGLYSLFIAGFYYLLSSVLDLDWFLSLVLGIIVSFVVSLLLNIINIRELKAILNTR